MPRICTSITPRFRRRVLHAGFAVLLVGVAATYLVIDAHQMTVTSWHLAGPLLVAGFGVGFHSVERDHELGSGIRRRRGGVPAVRFHQG